MPETRKIGRSGFISAEHDTGDFFTIHDREDASMTWTVSFSEIQDLESFRLAILEHEHLGGPKKCHIPGCDRDSLPGMAVCAACRLSYLNGVIDGNSGRRKPPKTLCSACGHHPHRGRRCGWHGGSCVDASTDPSLWCPCDGKRPWGGTA